MIWLLIAAGLVFVLALLFVMALCTAAAAGDRIAERAHPPRPHPPLDKRPDAADTARGMTEGK